MIRKVFICSAGIYMYLILVFIHMDLFVKNSIYVAFEKQLSQSEIKEGLSLRHRRLAEFDYPEYSQTTSEPDYKNNCDTAKVEECPMQCKQEKEKPGTVNFNRNIGKPSVGCELQNLVRNCSDFKRVYGYNSLPITQEERTFPLAFAFKMHDRPEQAEKILRSIYRSHNVYCIHVDQRADEKTYEVIERVGKCFENVIIIKDREYMVHSSFTHVATDLKCMQAVLKSNIPWRYYINLSPSEFPLKTNLEMVAILQFFQGMNDIETYDHPVDHNWKVENTFSIHGNSLAQESKKTKMSYNLKISKGNPHGLLSREFVEFVFKDDVAQYIINYLKDTYAPAENIWATLVTLPWAPGGYPVEIRHMISTYVSRAMIFTGDKQRCYGRFVRGYCQFSCGDLPWLKSRPEFFASKLDSYHNKHVLNCLVDWYRTKAIKPGLQGIDWNYYSRLPHVKYYRRHKHLLQSRFEREKIKKEWLQNNTIPVSH